MPHAVFVRSVHLFSAALFLALGACSGGENDGPIRVTVIGPAPAIADPDDGAVEPPTAVLLSAVAQGLVAFDAAGQIEPALAQRWMVTDDGLSYIFRLRDARWPDGNPVTAQQVARAIMGATARDSDNPLRTAIEAIDEVVAVTPEIIEIRLTNPRPPLLELLAQPEFALIDGPGGPGPLRVAAPGMTPLTLVPADPESVLADDDVEPVPPILLSGGRAALAVARFVGGDTDLVLGGTLIDLPVARAAEPAGGLLRFDPANGLLALAVVAAEGFLADPLNREALALAIDRGRIVAGFAVPDWQPVETILPARYRSAVDPAAPRWAGVSAADRRAIAIARVAAWSAEAGARPTLRIAMPDGPGARLLFSYLSADLLEAGIDLVRVGEGQAADLKLIDRVAPAGSAIWFLSALGCAADNYCDPAVAAALDAARAAPTLATRGFALAAADRALADSATLIPIARPLRWSLVAPRIGGFEPNAHAVHPLHRLIARR